MTTTEGKIKKNDRQEALYGRFARFLCSCRARDQKIQQYTFLSTLPSQIYRQASVELILNLISTESTHFRINFHVYEQADMLKSSN